MIELQYEYTRTRTLYSWYDAIRTAAVDTKGAGFFTSCQLLVTESCIRGTLLLYSPVPGTWCIGLYEASTSTA